MPIYRAKISEFKLNSIDLFSKEHSLSQSFCHHNQITIHYYSILALSYGMKEDNELFINGLSFSHAGEKFEDVLNWMKQL